VEGFVSTDTIQFLYITNVLQKLTQYLKSAKPSKAVFSEFANELGLTSQMVQQQLPWSMSKTINSRVVVMEI